MFIKEVIIDGFKSYAEKTVINGFDKQFNAITGLNGSGKSNIFDAICFVMGISSLGHMRAASLQELIFKYGQANVVKAMVSLVFDNSEKDKSPVGFEDCDSIIFTRTIQAGKSRYFINGFTATQDNIRTLFQSVQLNINNPHFLIMQGKVMQVVNMKPLEILSLLEEAAGTSIFQSKKDASLKMIAKKDTKVTEINEIIQGEITPQLEKLRADKVVYLNWKETENEIIKLKKITVAFRYNHLFNLIEQMKGEIEEIELSIGEKGQECAKMKEELDKINAEVEIQEKKTNFGNNSELTQLRETKKKMETEMKASKNLLAGLTVELKKKRKMKMQITKELDELKIAKESGIKQQEALEKKKEGIVETVRSTEKELRETEVNLQDFRSGKLNKENEINQYKQRIISIEGHIQKKNLEKQRIRQRVANLKEEMKENKEKVDKIKDKLSNTNRNENNSQEELENITDQIEQLNSELASKEVLSRKIEEARSKAQLAERQANEITMRHGYRLSVKFRDPEPNFDRSKVWGRLINLIRVKNEKYITALEYIAGGRLFNYVVDNEITSTLLISRKCFDYAVNIIPDSKLVARTMPQDKVSRAKQICGGECFLASELLEYDPRIQNTINYVFGNALVCHSAQVASRLAFDKSIHVKCYSIQGEIYDPFGSVTGGGAVRQESMLKKAQELVNLTSAFEKERRTLRELEDQHNVLQKKNRLKTELSFKLESLRNEKGGTEEKLKEKLAEVTVKITELERDVAMEEESLNALKDAELELNRQLKTNENSLEDVKKGRKGDEAYKDKINELKSALASMNMKLSQIKKQISSITLDFENKVKEIANLEENLSGETASLQEIESEFSVAVETQNKNEAVLQQTNAELLIKESEYEKEMEELNKMRSKQQSLREKITSLKAEISKVTAKKAKNTEDVAEKEKEMLILEKENTWITDEKALFGNISSEYNFSDVNYEEKMQRLAELEEENKALKRKVNMKVDALLDAYEKQYNDLISKRNTMLKDKATIEKVIEELDLERIKELDNVFAEVNQNFNSIFTTLLPGTSAKLSFVEEGDLMKGLEMRVAFNNTWKESLIELSGGQKSLLALSLILALLKYKPAPLYILDEIDAALDLSHTQNLGIMIKKYFPQSQFLIVSLKDGMFNNANVLFKVHFQNGSSRVNRVVAKKSLKL